MDSVAEIDGTRDWDEELELARKEARREALKENADVVRALYGHVGEVLWHIFHIHAKFYSKDEGVTIPTDYWDRFFHHKALELQGMIRENRSYDGD